MRAVVVAASPPWRKAEICALRRGAAAERREMPLPPAAVCATEHFFNVGIIQRNAEWFYVWSWPVSQRSLDMEVLESALLLRL
jgi:hypothetical protein